MKISIGKLFLIASLTLIIYSCSTSDEEINQWRGINRDGIYFEQNLLKEWPNEGPEVLWEKVGIGNGYGSPVISGNKIFVAGEIDSIGYLFAFDLEGNEIWKSVYGIEYTRSFKGSRSSPTVVGDLLYISSGEGEINCFNSKNGNKEWSLNMIDDLNGKINRFGYSQSLVVNGSSVYCAPGGQDTNFVALDRFNGEIQWISKGTEQISAYCSPLLISHNGTEILASFSQTNFFGIDSDNGDLLWIHPQDTMRKIHDIHSNTPVYADGSIYYVAGSGNKGVRLDLSEDGSTINEMWRNKAFDNMQGGFVRYENSLIGTSLNKKDLKRVDMSSGETIDSIKMDRGITILADDMIYCYTIKGDMNLVGIDSEGLKLISSYKIKKGTKEHFAHPVINAGRLFVRHGDAMIVYNIASDN